MNRDKSWGALRARSKSAGFWNEVLAAKENCIKDAKRMVFADIKPEGSSAAYGFYLIARRSPTDAAKFLKDYLPKTLREEAKRGSTFADDTEKLIKHTRMVEEMGSDAAPYERELLNKQAKADGR